MNYICVWVIQGLFKNILCTLLYIKFEDSPPQLELQPSDTFKDLGMRLWIMPEYGKSQNAGTIMHKSAYGQQKTYVK
jgi:hypothetical protein